RNGASHEQGHPGEIGDLARVTPGVEGEHGTVTRGYDDREASYRRQEEPPARRRLRPRVPSVRTDDERDRRIPARAVPAREEEDGVAPPAVVGDIAEPQLPDAAARRPETEGPRLSAPWGDAGDCRRGRDGERRDRNGRDRQEPSGRRAYPGHAETLWNARRDTFRLLPS